MPSWLWGWDKVAHTGLYLILGATLGYGKHHARPAPPHWVLIGIGALYGASDEWHQAFVDGRTPDWTDWVADVAGVSLGYIAVLLLLRWMWPHEERSQEERSQKGADAR